MSQKLLPIAKKLAHAFQNNKAISPISESITKNSKISNQLRKISESLVRSPIIGFKAGGTGKAMLKKMGEKEPFYAAIFKKNLLKSGATIKLPKYTMGIELEVFYLIKNSFFNFRKKITEKNVSKFIKSLGACIELVGYRQKKKGIKYLGDLISDFGANIKFIIGKGIKYKKLPFHNLETKLENKKSGQVSNGNTKAVYDSPVKSLVWVLNKVLKDKVNLNKDFYVFTGSTVGVVPIQKNGLFEGKIKSIGYVKSTVK
jgi:2-keto-4-pentenoate hydratase